MTKAPTLKLKWKSDLTDGDVFALQYSKDKSFIGCALSNGQVGLYSPTTGRLSYALDQNSEHLPATSFRFHPSSKFFIAGSSNGNVNCWSTRKPAIIWEEKEDNNEIFCIDMNLDGSKFATAGLDTKVRLYDFESHSIISILEKSSDIDSDPVPGHTNRVFSVLFDPLNPFTLFSSGWDETIQIWDLRIGKSVRSLFGVHVCSDSMDLFLNQLAVGSWRTTDQLQIWDLRTFKVSKTFKWKEGKQCLVYATKFSPDGEFLYAGGSGFDEIGIFSTQTGSQIGQTIALENPVFTIALTKDGKELIAGETKGKINSYTINT
ncbi:hypothetical protein M9Y10_043107 [Tritrichomonas musculus]|uniref:Uncharacterized protein n=1 Tax=Tritrichomonas musculus TaxID=1915356 RepID=A0ABR2JYY8_9EUKA